MQCIALTYSTNDWLDWVMTEMILTDVLQEHLLPAIKKWFPAERLKH